MAVNAAINAVLGFLAMSGVAGAVTGVHPTGVNVNASGTTTVFLSFQGLGPDEVPTDAFWCGEITVPANTVVGFDPCVAGTLLGNLPARNNLARRSTAAGAVTLTDIMTIPASVARRAYQLARGGDNSSFFYVRRFVNTQTGAASFVAVTCRLAGGGARVPLALTRVDLNFITGQDPPPTVLYVADGEAAPPVAARIRYNGAGNLRGRWEVVLPGEVLPEADDLLPEPSLPVEQRGSQRRYTVLKRFDVFLPPGGELSLEGPAADQVPTDASGPYLILLRIEASADKEGDSQTGAGTVHTGGVAGFPLPVLRYYVGNSMQQSGQHESSNRFSIRLLQPDDGAALPAGTPLAFAWIPMADGALQRLVVRDASAERASAVLELHVNSYRAPPWLSESRGPMSWQVETLDAEGNVIHASPPRTLTIQ